jgi:hypothetical protein
LEISKCSIDSDSLKKIKEILSDEAKKIVAVIQDETTNELANDGYDVTNVPAEHQITCMSYAKQSLQELINDIADGIYECITTKPIPAAAPIPMPGAQNQQMAQPLVNMGAGYNPIPDFSDDPDISKHFVIGSNVVIYDPNQKSAFKGILKSLAQQLDEKDKEQKLSEPSRYGFLQFDNIGQFVAVRLNSQNCFYMPNDVANYMAISMVNGQIVFTCPQVAA